MNKKGFLLLEYCIALMLASLTLFVFRDTFLQSITTCQKVASDLEIYRVERATMALLRENIGFNVEKVELLEDASGEARVVCQETAAKRNVYYYCSESPTGKHVMTLYQKIKVEDKSSGINPLTTPNMEVTAWHAEKLSEKSFLLAFSIRECSSGREKKFFEVINLCNGRVL
ncbi:hypothetical protein SDC9_144730 [bioreactor metagenome]|uniref:Prepilin-type N-terminal cleavage/methylation domain-containing protein n=1 Tax=bioreactor metagenome TaxID=1076179 RepID=A0A645E7J4_9ZZZZ